MNKICTVAKNKNTYFIERLIKEVGDSVVFFNPWTDLEIPAADKYLVRTTGVYGHDLDLLILKTLPAEKIINPLESLVLCRSKSSQYQWFESEDIPCLPWLPVENTDLITIEKFFRLYPELIVKPTIGQGGWGIEVLTWEKFKTWKKKKGQDQKYLLQPFLKVAREFRYFFIKGQAPVVLERQGTSGLRANFKQEGSAKVSKLDPLVEDILQKVIEKSGAFYGAIDVLTKDGQLFILELNSCPGIEQLEKVSGEKIMRNLLKNF